MAVISGAISISKIKSALGSPFNDIGGLCNSQAINKWSKCKPVNLYRLTHNRLSAGEADDGWWKGVNGNCGIIIPTYTNIKGLYDAWDDFENGWSRETVAAQAGSHPFFRFADFDNYDHNAESPFLNFNIGRTSATKNDQVHYYVEARVKPVSSSTSLALGDFGNMKVSGETRLTGCYLGMLVYYNSSNYSYMTGDKTIAEMQALLSAQETNVSFEVVFSCADTLPSVNTGDLQIMPILCTTPWVAGDPEPSSNVFVPCCLEHKVLRIETAASPYVSILSAIITGTSSNKLTANIYFNAGSVAQQTFSPIDLIIVTASGDNTGMIKHITDSIVVAKNGHIERAFEITDTDLGLELSAWRQFVQYCYDGRYLLKVVVSNTSVAANTANITNK